MKNSHPPPPLHCQKTLPYGGKNEMHKCMTLIEPQYKYFFDLKQ